MSAAPWIDAVMKMLRPYAYSEVREVLEKLAKELNILEPPTEITESATKALIWLAENAAAGGSGTKLTLDGEPYAHTDAEGITVHIIWSTNGDDLALAVLVVKDGRLLRCVAAVWIV